MAEQERILLPKELKPSHYDLYLTPNLVDFTFSGKVYVTLKVLQSVTKIDLHAIELEFQQIKVSQQDKHYEIQPSDVKFDTALEQASIPLSNPLAVGEATLEIHFTGILNDQLKGFYRSRSEGKYIATTQFESTDARRAFPCWDEPALKATFSVILNIEEDQMGLSNMPVVEERHTTINEKRYKQLFFDKTPIMSTYLLAFIVGNFDYVEDKTEEGVLVRVYTPPGKSSQGMFSLSMATRTLSFFTEYFGIEYPLPKCDMIAIADFAMGAMENWGLITYREVDILIDEVTSGVATKQRVAYVIAHELAHQWFGNLVTMEWWKELWLNEGFATWVGCLATHQFYPEWDIWTKFCTDYFARALSLDSLLSSHPIEVEVYNSDQIGEIFDLISYCKGASIIHMIANYLGEDDFKRGLNIYLNRHKYKNAVTEDLWVALSESSGKDVKSFMDNWTKKTGFPVISITQDPQHPNFFNVTQNRFLAQGIAEEKDDQTIWNCSIGFTSAAHQPFIKYVDITNRSQTIELPAEVVGDNSFWIKANALQTGFFHVKYSSDLLARFQKGIETLQLKAVDRMAIQADAVALASSGRIKTSDFLRVASYYENEEDYIVLLDLSGSLTKVSNTFRNESFYPLLEAFFLRIYAKIAKKLGWEDQPDDADNTKLLRTLVIKKAADFGSQEIIEQGKKIFAAGDFSKISSDLIGVIYHIAVKYGGEEEYNKVLDIYRTASMHTERMKALRALGSNESMVIKTLEFSLTDEVRNQDKFYVNITTSETPKGRDLTWQFVKDNFAKYNSIYDTQKSLLGHVAEYTVMGYSSFEKADEIEEFFKQNPIHAAERAIAQALERIRTRAAWLQRDCEDVKAFIESQQ